jgi:murein DD-endopeptidase MepM/ murein hydrolase activator NlpD
MIEAPFPERHIYIRATGETRGLVLTTGQQLTAVAAACGVAVWIAFTTLGMGIAALSAHHSDQEVQATRAAYARIIASHDARLIAAVDTLAAARADHLRATLRMAGVNPDTAAPAGGGQGGPLIDAKDPRAVEAMVEENRQLAAPVLRAAKDVADMRALAAASSSLPLARPTKGTDQSSGYGVRQDPFTGHAAFHPGLDFPGAIMTPVYATAPGVVSFTGVRNGYGSTVEIDHGQGFRTRFAHLAAISVRQGQRVTSQQAIGAMGSTGRSTGPHLHYEVWRDGQPQDPERFLKAGDYVQQAG